MNINCTQNSTITSALNIENSENTTNSQQQNTVINGLAIESLNNNKVTENRENTPKLTRRQKNAIHQRHARKMKKEHMNALKQERQAYITWLAMFKNEPSDIIEKQNRPSEEKINQSISPATEKENLCNTPMAIASRKYRKKVKHEYAYLTLIVENLKKSMENELTLYDNAELPINENSLQDNAAVPENR